jgi:flavin reductase (DIM6/NTAB) family NADH-FMN oxidoreductase RutF
MSIEPRVFRDTLGQFVTGVTVIVMEAGGSVRAMTANSFTSLSLDPPLVLFCVGKATRMGELAHTAAGFSINILCREQQDISTYFAGAWRDAEPPPFTLVEWEGSPRLEGSAASLGCTIEQIHEGGDHWIVVGRVVAVHRADGVRVPLVYFGGRYVTIEEAIASIG